jgi:hypothetical protein
VKRLDKELAERTPDEIRSVLEMQIQEVLGIIALAEMVKPRVKKAQYDQWEADLSFKYRFMIQHYWAEKETIKNTRLKKVVKHVQEMPMQKTATRDDSAEDMETEDD